MIFGDKTRGEHRTGAVEGSDDTSWLPHALPLALASMLIAQASGLLGTDATPASRLLAVTALPALIAPLFVRASRAATGGLARPVSDWALATLLLAVVAWLATGGWPLPRTAAPVAVALGVVVVTMLAADVVAALVQRAGIEASAAHESARWLVTAVLWLLAAAPLWLGPLADLTSRHGPAFAEATVAMSPLVHVALAAGQDLLRTEWFYAHSSLGSLQFDYPSLTTIAAGYVVVMAALALCAYVLSRRAPATAPLRHALPT